MHLPLHNVNFIHSVPGGLTSLGTYRIDRQVVGSTFLSLPLTAWTAIAPPELETLVYLRKEGDSEWSCLRLDMAGWCARTRRDGRKRSERQPYSGPTSGISQLEGACLLPFINQWKLPMWTSMVGESSRCGQATPSD